MPDFVAVARDWDAVHLTLGGLLAAEQARLAGPEGPTELQGWDVEQTVWLRWVFDNVTRLPDRDVVTESDARLGPLHRSATEVVALVPAAPALD